MILHDLEKTSHCITIREKYIMKTRMEKYMKSLKAYSAISSEDEKTLATKSFNGDLEAREELISRNVKLVVHIAHDYFWLGKRLGAQHKDDIIQEGNMALCEAARLYDPNKTDHFRNYASAWIRALIKQYISKAMKHGATSGEYIEDSRDDDDEYNFMSPKYTKDGSDSVLTLLTNKERLFIIGNTLQSINRRLSHAEKYILNYRIMSEWPKTQPEISNILKFSIRTIVSIEENLINKIKNIMKTMNEFNDNF